MNDQACMARRPVVRRPVRLTRIERAVAFVLRHPVKLSAAAFAVLSASGTAWASRPFCLVFPSCISS